MQQNYPSPISVRIGEWTIDPATGLMSRDGQLLRLDDRTRRLLVCLARHAGTVVSVETLLKQVWRDPLATADDVADGILLLRDQLGDDRDQPTYIVEVPRRGYRLVAPLSNLSNTAEPETEVIDGSVAAPVAAPAPAPAPAPLPSNDVADEPFSSPAARGGRARWWAVGAVAAAAIAAIAYFTIGSAPPPPPTVAVMPFLELSEKLNEVPFADGVTEDIIVKLKAMPALAVSPPAASFSLRATPMSFSEFGEALKVDYVVDGSVFKEGNTLKVAARVTRASDGTTLWSESYHRTWEEKLAIQDEIVARVAKALEQPPK